ncbi:hypothetical protein DTO96_102544 [Ephemeroptericola cinctiostellae]|uniref:Uncharacterized protein n=1 Tax=Ephemeroptericola cinctiostellae TaxID=2268024 RepID=A0A345DEK0_9BURK|nr:phage regulatory CII family protein [Ephemeroptericola cinctiostellae]AXF86788.1 hypothetical protein DTO96_102544 [Ephemeroptericola cinctiostellae]
MSMTHTQDDVFAALRSVADDFGVRKLATLMDVAQGTLHNKLNPNDSSAHHKPTVSDLIQIVSHTANTAPIEALAALFGGVFYRLPDMAHCSDDALLALVNNVGAQVGAVHDVMAAAMADLVVTPAEFKLYQEQTHRTIAAFMELKARFKTLVVQVR